MPTGKVIRFNPVRGFGFIKPDSGSNDVFVHISAVEAAGLEGLSEDQAINYEIVEDKRGRSSAGNLELIND